MSTSELAISLHDKQTLLIKDLTVKERFKAKSEHQVLSNDIYLPGYEQKPIKIGLAFNFSDYTKGCSIVFVENGDFLLNDLEFRYIWSPDGKQSGNVYKIYEIMTVFFSPYWKPCY